MEAKDTVINLLELKAKRNVNLVDAYEGAWEAFEQLAEAQAEISFKAGRESWFLGYKPTPVDKKLYLFEAQVICLINEGVKQGKEVGIREVVEWIESNHTLVEKRLDWQAQKKAWGIVKDDNARANQAE